MATDAVALQHPAFEVRNANRATLISNDNWSQDPDKIEVANAGLAPSSGEEAAVAITLGAGAHTALLSAKTVSFIDLRGVGLVEVYSRGRVP